MRHSSARRKRPLKPEALTRATSLSLPSRLPIDAWMEIGQQLSRISDSSSWWLGDWLVYGQQKYPERYKAAIEETSLDYQTLRNYAWIARKFPVSRRRDTLSMQHHVEVAALSANEQDQWLSRAEEMGWSRNELRRQMKGGRQAHCNGNSIRLGNAIEIRVTEERKQLWELAAEKADCDLSDWIIQTVDAAATVADSAEASVL
ncbi:LmbU family transcriptional regulator [Nonomuraea sp. NPDC050547]|uniref:LmbU family transcriptional regulator n=1 Tax=unclassified Nonomuraea TaxID=2593643 RepID=UPI003792B5CF